MAKNTPESQKPQRAGIYARISVASIGDTTKTDDQERICRDLAARLGWEVVDVYCDHSLSAWKKNVIRHEWNRMLADVNAGRINAIVNYHGDRLIRQPRDLETLIDLAENKGIRLAAPTGERDLDNKDDRAMLRVIAAFACLESDRISERRKSQYERWHRQGKVRPGGRGGRPFGFATDGVTLVPAEAAIIREAARRILAGESSSSLARELAGRGVLTPPGNPMSRAALRKMLARPRMAGLMPDGIHRAAWEPILDRPAWEALCAALNANWAGSLAFGHATKARRWLLTGIAECGACGARLHIKTETRAGKGASSYRCTACRKVNRSVALLDEYVITRVIAKLGDPRNPAARVPASPALASEFAALARQRAEVEALLADYAKGSPRALMQRLESIDARLAQLRDLAAGTASARLLGAHAGLDRAAFDDLPLATRRALVAACYRITVLPASKRGPGFRTEDVRLTPP